MLGNWQGEREETMVYIWTTCAMNFKCAESTLRAGEGIWLSRHLEMVEPHVCIQTRRSKTLTLRNVRQVKSAAAQRSKTFLGQCLLTRPHDTCYYKGKDVRLLGPYDLAQITELLFIIWIILDNNSDLLCVYTWEYMCVYVCVNPGGHSSRDIHLFCFLETTGLSQVLVTQLC